MELSNLFASSDNLFKFLFIGGITMIVMSLVYPMQKQQILEIEINTHNQQTSLLNNEILSLNDKVKKLSLKSKPTYSLLDSLSKVRTKKNHILITKKIEDVKKEYNTQFLIIKNSQNEIKTKNIIIEFNKKKIKILQSHSNQYGSYSWWLKWVGLLFTVIGLFFWGKSTFLTEKLKKKEYKKIE